MKLDESRHILLDAGMKANSDLVEWSIDGIDLSDRDGDLFQSTLDDSSQNYGENLHTQEQLRKECGIDGDYDVQTEDETTCSTFGCRRSRR